MSTIASSCTPLHALPVVFRAATETHICFREGLTDSDESTPSVVPQLEMAQENQGHIRDKSWAVM
jgi:hypothetical protein